MTDYGWPDLMTIATACDYTQRSRWTLKRAVHAGELAIAGKRGRVVVFHKEDLQAWMLGPPLAAPTASPSRTVTSASNAAALERIKQIAKGKR